MAHGMTIAKWVSECLKETDSVEAIYRSCQERFPHRALAWSYVSRLVKQAKEFEKEAL
jgi:hypothetical protein